MRALLALLLIASLAGCYRIPVPQGNFVTQHSAMRIKQGMTQAQVIQTLGDPVLDNVYLNGQLAYVYTYKSTFSSLKRARLIVRFDSNGRVSSTQFVSKPAGFPAAHT